MSEDADGRTPESGDRTARNTLWGLLVGAGVIVVVALIAVFGRGAAPPYPEDTPEGVVQRYAQAVVDGDFDAAADLLLREDAADCERMPSGGDYRVTLVETTERDATARVEVIVSEVYGSGLFGPEEYSSEEVFDLRRADGGWRIEAMPWQFVICDGSRTR